MGLAAMMHLMLKQVQQHAVEPLALQVAFTLQLGGARECVRVKPIDQGDQPRIDLPLRRRERRNGPARLRICPSRGTEPAAFHGIDVEAIDHEDMIERRRQARKEPGARRGEIGG